MTTANEPARVDAPLREVYSVLREQWAAAVATRAPLIRFLATRDEPEWIESFFGSPMDRATRLLSVETPFEVTDDYGLAVLRRLLDRLAKERAPGVAPWRPALRAGARDVDQLALTLASFANHHAGTWIRTVALQLAPASVRDEGAFHGWIDGFVRQIAPQAPSARIVVLDDAHQPRLDRLCGGLGRGACTIPVNLRIPDRIAAMTEASADMSSFGGQLRVLSMRAMLLVRGGRLREAEAIANAIEALAGQASFHAAVVPARFSIGAGHLAQQTPLEAATSYRAAELAAERAQVAGDPLGLRLRIYSRFGVGAALLAVPDGLPTAATYYEGTVPLCAELGDAQLELDAHRMAGVAHERCGRTNKAWESALRGLSCLPRVPEAARASGAMAPFADWAISLAERHSTGHERRSLEDGFARLGVRWSSQR